MRGRPDPVMLEVFNNLFMHAAEQMGVVLENTAHSVNIKERLDFSCALFDGAGELVANAPHIPVHLGSMGDSVQSVLRLKPLPGDVYLLNTPYNGGTHLPDMTVVTPVFGRARARRRAAPLCRREPRAPRRHRRHHAGLDAARQPHDRRRRRAARRRAHRRARRVPRSASCGSCSARGPHPARNPDQNVADLKAQIAANARGIAELEQARRALRACAASHALHAARAAQRRGQRARRDRAPLRDGRFSGRARRRRAHRGRGRDRSRRDAPRRSTSRARRRASAGNFNAPSAIVRAAVLYVFRTLGAREHPAERRVPQAAHDRAAGARAC